MNKHFWRFRLNSEYFEGAHHKQFNMLIRYEFVLELDMVSAPTINPYLIVAQWLILYAIKSSQQKSLSGFDDTTAVAMNGFNYLQTGAQKYGNRYIKNSLEKGKQYLKSRYEMNCNSTNSSVIVCLKLYLILLQTHCKK